MNVAVIVISVGLIQGFFLTFVLLTAKRGNKRANRLLGLFIFLFTITLGHVFIELTKLYLDYPHVLLIVHPIQFLFGPILLAYVLALTDPKFRFKKKYLFHFLPFLINVVYFTLTFYIKSAEYKIYRFETWRLSVTAADYFWSLSHVVYTTPYLVACVIAVKKHQERVKSSFSSIEKIKLAWLQRLLYIIIFIFVINTIFDVLYFLNIGRYAGNPIMGMIVAVVIYAIGYMGWQQPEIFIATNIPTAKEKYKTSTLSPQQMQKYKQKLLDVMQTEKPFLNSSLTIKELAEKMHIQDYQLSQIINQQFNQNFFDFINSHRIKEARQKLSDPNNAHFSILAIAYDVGFNSKSAFNTAFKKHTGLTPSQFRAQSET